jgi:UV DNA damage endonuclease
MGINEGLSKDDRITVNRGMVKKTFMSKGVTYVSELIQQNLSDCLKILKHNKSKGILVYRMSSDMFPWVTHYKISDLPNYTKIKFQCKLIGQYVMENNIRVGFHPGQFCVIGSDNENTVNMSITELDRHAEILDMMDLPQTPFYGINIHLSNTKPTLEHAAARFCDAYARLSDSAQKRLTVENDDKEAQYTVKHLYDMVHSKIGIPIIADSLHYQCHPGDMTWEETFMLAISTWGEHKPLCHHSTSAKLYEDEKEMKRAHTEYLHERFENFDIPVDIELECKMKDLALIKYKIDYLW